MKILTIVGTRPEAIKLAPVLRQLREHASHTTSRLCVTAQHRAMLDQVLSLFQLEPDYDLNLMKEGQSPAQVAALVLSRLEPILREEKPDWVLVQGDTTTALAGALAAFYAGVKVGHVEAGLRTFNRQEPFPEELNRRLVSVAADLHFAPTSQARENLLREGVSEERILVTGNTVIDALLSVAELPYDLDNGPLAGLPWDKRIVLVTAHRRENLGAPLERICNAVRALARRHAESIQVVYSVHSNPQVQAPVRACLGAEPNVTLLPPLDYQSMVQLLKRCHLLLTDSGGLQEEAPSLDKPVLVLRDTTERPEGIAAGTVKLVGTDPRRIVEETERLLEGADAYARMARAVNPYGDGRAAEQAVGDRRINMAICLGPVCVKPTPNGGSPDSWPAAISG